MDNNYYLPGNIFTELFQYLSQEVSTADAAAFASYFQEENGMYHCTNYSGYMDWLEGFFEGDNDYGLFVAWDKEMLARSSQGGIFNVLPIN